MAQRNAMKTGSPGLLPSEALYLPFEAGLHRMLMSLVARDPDELIENDETYPAEMAERRALLDKRCNEVFAVQSVSQQASARPWTASRPCCWSVTPHGARGMATDYVTA